MNLGRIVCAWCSKVMRVGFPGDHENHGVCPDCFRDEMRRMTLDQFRHKMDWTENNAPNFMVDLGGEG